MNRQPFSQANFSFVRHDDISGKYDRKLKGLTATLT